MRALRFSLFVILSAVFALAQTHGAPRKPKAATGHARLDMLDKSVDPCTDFYAYACNQWQAQNPIPPDRASWGAFDEMTARTASVIRGIVEKYARNDPKRTADEKKIGDYYSSCMDEKTIEKAGLDPIASDLDSINALQSSDQLVREIAHLQREGAYALFNFDVDQDFKDATQETAEIIQGGMALPDRDYYLKEDSPALELRKQYLAHVQKMFELLGDAPERAAAEAKAVLNIETKLAGSALDRASRRDPNKVYHKMTWQELVSLSPAFDWNNYRRAIGAPKIEALNVSEPEFVKAIDELMRTVSLEDWKAYLRWQVVHSDSMLLPARFADESFDFFHKTMAGARELPPRWKRCVSYTDYDLGEAVGKKYVELAFSPASKARVLTMVYMLEAALAGDIDNVDWMSFQTKRRAHQKLAAITNRIGYPNQWRDYSGLAVIRGDALGNSLRANEFRFQRELTKIGKPVDKDEWPYSPATVDASYNPQMNNITFPAGILQPPFFDIHADDALNFGAIGSFIGHELTHGFDDQGSQFDGDGNLRNWWTEDDKKAFQERTKCITDQYAHYTAVDDLKLNGELTTGENVADNGGLRVAYAALVGALLGKPPQIIGGLNPEQRFFVGWASAWCQNRTDAYRRMLVTLDTHSPPNWRVNGAVSNMPAFRQAFHCKEDAPMVRKNACWVW